MAVATIALASMMTSCENDDFLYQDSNKIWLAGDPKQQATKDSVLYTFRLYDKTVQEATINIVANLTGAMTDYDRTFELEVVDSLTNAPAGSYEVGKCIMPANEYKVTVPVKVKRSVTGIDMAKKTARLALRVKPTNDLGASVDDRVVYKIVWCDYLIKPESWNIVSYYIGDFSQARFKFIIDYTGIKDFKDYDGDYSRQLGLKALLIRLLDEYNSDPANAGNEAGWPYLDDDGQPLHF